MNARCDDRGGVFASFVGAMELLEPEERARVAGFVVNKFRGERPLLEPGLEFLRRRTGVPVLYVIPYISGLQIADEDSLSLELGMDELRMDKDKAKKPPSPNSIDIAVVSLPRISNYDDVLPLEHLPGVTVRFVTVPGEVRDADLLILPGSKSTLSDLDWLRNRGRAASGRPVMGLCGGCQMRGSRFMTRTAWSPQCPTQKVLIYYR
jgi:adenosylcobyric acid synthase